MRELDTFTALEGTGGEELAAAGAIDLRGRALQDVSLLRACPTLRHAVLSGNILSRLEPPGLLGCTRLVKLDLSHNALRVLPGRSEWAALANLRVLYLHSNQLASLKACQALAALPAIERLTLFDNPLCSHPAYRHFLVNTIALRCLDERIVADDEIIEGVSFGPESRFWRGSPRLHFPVMEEPQVQSEELVAVFERALIAELASLAGSHARSSPVLTVQGHVRRRAAIALVHPLRSAKRAACGGEDTRGRREEVEAPVSPVPLGMAMAPASDACIERAEPMLAPVLTPPDDGLATERAWDMAASLIAAGWRNRLALREKRRTADARGEEPNSHLQALQLAIGRARDASTMVPTAALLLPSAPPQQPPLNLAVEQMALAMLMQEQALGVCGLPPAVSIEVPDASCHQKTMQAQQQREEILWAQRAAAQQRADEEQALRSAHNARARDAAANRAVVHALRALQRKPAQIQPSEAQAVALQIVRNDHLEQQRQRTAETRAAERRALERRGEDALAVREELMVQRRSERRHLALACAVQRQEEEEETRRRWERIREERAQRGARLAKRDVAGEFARRHGALGRQMRQGERMRIWQERQARAELVVDSARRLARATRAQRREQRGGGG